MKLEPGDILEFKLNEFSLPYIYLGQEKRTRDMQEWTIHIIFSLNQGIKQFFYDEEWRTQIFSRSTKLS